MTIDQLAALDAALEAIGPEVCDLRDRMNALADHFTTDDPTSARPCARR